ncbi:MAG: glutathione peroxidase [Bacteroidetes bacterium]|nr:glutathione peroxidase [Bacteroidota bacterium]
MKKLLFRYFSGIFISAVSIFSFSSYKNVPKGTVGHHQTIYDFKLKTLEGEEITLAKFKGKKMLLINVASECGFTPQYKSLQALHEQYGSKVVLVGFPANNFGGQEPGSSTEIKTFCTKNYGVTFQMMDKISVKGSDMHPLYKWLSTKEENGTCSDAPNWNFCKYLIDEKGKIIKFFPSKIDPMSKDITGLL